MDAKQCSKECQGYPYFGTTDGDRCTCGKKAPSTGVVTNCDTPCSGNDKVVCGSCSAMSVFKYDGPGGMPSPTPTAKPVDGGAMWKYVDCFEDDGNNRVLDGPRKDSASGMTAQACSKFCEGYKYFGTEYGMQCFCGDTQPSTKSKKCSMPCSGDDTETCGDRDAISLYKRDGPGDVECGKPQGCYMDYGHDRVLDGKSTRSKDMDDKYCSKFCKGYKYYGTEFGDECFCGNSLASKTAENCDMKCAGDRNEVCGGRDAINVYSASCPSPTPGHDHGHEHDHEHGHGHGGNDMEDGSARGAKNIGCYKDDAGDTRHRVLNGARTKSSKEMDAEYCSNFCRGYKYFGTEFGEECFCGDSEPSRMSDDCDMSCTGNSKEVCGGKKAVTVYKRDGGGDPGRKTEHIACYRDDGKRRIMTMGFLESDSMTLKKCGDYCVSKSSSAKYFGVEFGIQCFCSENDDFMDKAPIGDRECDMECSGDPGTDCGGRDAMDVYKL